jgi:putative oxidoreductase
MRLAISAILIHGFIGPLTEATNVMQAGPAILAEGTAMLLLAGLWTPAAGLFAAFLELGIAYSRPTQFWESMLAASVGLGLALIGPGTWSIDARFYGRKRISIGGR